MGIALAILLGLVLVAIILGGPLVAVLTIFDRTRSRLRIVLITGILLVLMGIGVEISGLKELIFNFPLPLGIFNLIVWGVKHHKHREQHREQHRHLTLNEEALEEEERYEITQKAHDQAPPPHTAPPQHTAPTAPTAEKEKTGALPLWASFGISLGLIMLFFEFMMVESNMDPVKDRSSFYMMWMLYILIIILGFSFFTSIYIRKHLPKATFHHLVFNIVAIAIIVSVIQNSIYFFDSHTWTSVDFITNQLLRSCLINFSVGAALGYLLLPGKHLLFKKTTKEPEQNNN